MLSKRITLLTICCLGFFLGLSLYFFTPNSASILGASSYSAAEILSLVNAARQTQGLAPLKLNSKLTQAAEAKAQAMLATQSWSHNTPDSTPWKFLDQVGYTYVFAGENLAKNFSQATQVVDAWLNSQSHRNNLLSPSYTETGVAVVPYNDSSSNTVLIVEYLAKPLDSQYQDSNPDSFSSTIVVEHPSFYLKSIYIILGLLLSASLSLFLLKLLKSHPKTTLISSKHWTR